MSDFCMELLGATDATETQSSVSEVREEQGDLHASRDVIHRQPNKGVIAHIFSIIFHLQLWESGFILSSLLQHKQK